MKGQKLTLDHTLLLSQIEFHESIGILQHDLQHAVFASNLCNFLFDKSKAKWITLLHTFLNFTMAPRYMGKVIVNVIVNVTNDHCRRGVYLDSR